MYCTTCQADRQEDAKFCFECGAKVLKRCGNRKDDGTSCGEVLSDGATFCPECGCSQSPVTQAPLSGPAGPNVSAILESKQKTNDEQSKDQKCLSESDSEYVSAEEDADVSLSQEAEHDPEGVAKPQLAKERKKVTESERKLKQEHESNSVLISEPKDIKEAETGEYQELDHHEQKTELESDSEAQPKKALELEPGVTDLSQTQIMKEDSHAHPETTPSGENEVTENSRIGGNKNSEIEDMITEEDEYFLRASILLLKGGRLVSKQTLYKELRKAGGNLDVLLKQHERKLKHKFVRKQREKLFPDAGVTDVETWDLAMLTTVSLTVFKQSLNDDERNDLKSIKRMRDEIYAHTYSSSLSADQYEQIRKELQNALTSLSNGLSKKLKDDCLKIIQECTNGPISPSLKAELMKQIEDTEHSLQAVMNKLRNQNEFLREMRKEIMDKLNKIIVTEERSEKIIKVIDTELTLSGAVNESNDIDFVEGIITTVINKAIKKVGNENDYPRIRSVVDKILKDIENMPDVEILPTEHKCILLKFKCTTYIGILNMLMYLESRSFLESLNDLALALSSTLSDVNDQFSLDAIVTPECMKDLLDDLRAKTMETTKYERTIRVPIKVESVQGIKHIWSLFETGEATDKLNELSEAVFDELNTKITVTSSVNLEHVQAAIKEAGEKSAEVSQAAVEDNASSPQRDLSKSVDTDPEYVSAEKDADVSLSQEAEHDSKVVAKPQLAKEPKEMTKPERKLKQEHEPRSISGPISELKEIKEAETGEDQELDHHEKNTEPESDQEAQPKEAQEEVEPGETDLSQKQSLKKDSNALPEMKMTSRKIVGSAKTKNPETALTIFFEKI